MNDRSAPYCLVLSGGGAKGIYHIGVWKALRELDIPVNAFIGNSIGAIIAGYLAGGKGDRLEAIGAEIGVDFILRIPDELIEDGEIRINRKRLPAFRLFSRTTFSTGGLDTSPLRSHLEADIDEDSIRASGNDLAVVTYNVSDMRPREVVLEEMEPGTLVDYLMASSAFPGFQTPRINGKRYLDGGVFDNLPYALARSRGYRKIIAVDISGIGRHRKPEIQGAETVYIKNSIEMGGVLDFNRTFLDRFKHLGYLDAMRTFGRLVGYEYFIEPDQDLEARFASYLASEPARALLANKLEDSDTSLREQFPARMIHDRRTLLVLQECAATILEVERIAQYDYASLYRAIRENRTEIDQGLAQTTEAPAGTRAARRLESAIRRAFKREEFDDAPYRYYRLIEHVLRRPQSRLPGRGVSTVFPELSAGVIALDLLDAFWADELREP